MKVLLIRLLGLGDVASILVPAVRYEQALHPAARIDALTFGAGAQVMELVQELDTVLAVTPDQWPDDVDAALASFTRLASVIVQRGYDRIVNLDTWFMPCFLARLLRDAGQPVRGNVINQGAAALAAGVAQRSLDPQYFVNVHRYLESDLPGMAEWTTPWWTRHPDSGGYARFYLRHCCGYPGEPDARLPVAPDTAWAQAAGGRPLVALSLAGSRASKRYRHAQSLGALLEEAGCRVWSGFDGSVPLRDTLARLAASQLLVTVATSTQWLARAVGCPALMIPGPLPPEVLAAEATVERVRACQYCHQNTCAEGGDFGCLDIPPQQVAAQALAALRRFKDARPALS